MTTLKPGEPLFIHATAPAFESVGFDMPRTPTSSATTGPTPTEDSRDPAEEPQITNCGVLDIMAVPAGLDDIERVIATAQANLNRITGVRLCALDSDAKRIFAAGWEARSGYWGDLPENESEELLDREWAEFCKREGLAP